MMLSNDGIQWLSFSGSRFWLDLIGDFQSFRRVAAAAMQFLWPCLLFAPSTFANFLASNAIPSINVTGSSSPSVSEPELVSCGVCRAAPKSLCQCCPANPASSDSDTLRLASCCLVRRLLRAQCSQTLQFFWAGLPKLLGQRCCHFQSPPGL